MKQADCPTARECTQCQRFLNIPFPGSTPSMQSQLGLHLPHLRALLHLVAGQQSLWPEALHNEVHLNSQEVEQIMASSTIHWWLYPVCVPRHGGSPVCLPACLPVSHVRACMRMLRPCCLPCWQRSGRLGRSVRRPAAGPRTSASCRPASRRACGARVVSHPITLPTHTHGTVVT